ncbi:MAG: threonine aldolase family protein [Acetobacterium sp.]
MKSFLSDNASGVHSKIMEALVQANTEHASAYGEDPLTQKAHEIVGGIFGCGSDQVHFVINGTGANVLCNASALRSFESLVTTDTAHINGPETGSFENFSGSRIVTVAHVNGKLEIPKLNEIFSHTGDNHYSQPRMISISQLTEIGTLYTPEEIKAMADFAHAKGCLLHVDGARIANAAVTLGIDFKKMITDTGVDILSFGGTKNGLMFGEAIICFNKDLNTRMPYMVKHGNQLLSKMRFTGAQFIPYIRDDLWKQNAGNANAMAEILKKELIAAGYPNFCAEVQGNIVIVTLPETILTMLLEKELVHDVFYNNQRYCRFVTSFDTTEADIIDLIKIIKKY